MTDHETKMTAQDAELIGLSDAYAITCRTKEIRRQRSAAHGDGLSVAAVEHLLSSGSW